MTDLERIAAEIASRRRFQTSIGEPDHLPDGTSTSDFPYAVQMNLLMKSRPASWRRRVVEASGFAFCEEESARLRAALLVLGAEVVGWIADIDSREPALVPAKAKQKELVAVGVAGGMAG